MALKKRGALALTPQLSSTPSNPESGHSIIYPKTDGKWYAKMPDGTELEITNPPYPAANPMKTRITSWDTAWSSVTITTNGGGNTTASGSAITIARGVTTYLSTTKRTGYTTSAAIDSPAGLRNSSGSQMGAIDGFTFTIRFVLAIYASNQTIFIGPKNGSAAMAGTQVPSALLTMCGLLKDAGDTTFQFCTNDGSGTATKQNTGITPSNSIIYELVCYCPAGGASLTLTLNNLETRAQLATHTFVSDLPPTSSGMSWALHVATGAGTTQLQVDFVNAFLEVPQ